MNALLVTWFLLLPGDGSDATDRPAAKPADATPAADVLRPTLNEIFKPPTLLGRRPRLDAISADGRFVTYRWAEKDEEEPKASLWLTRTDGTVDPIRLFDEDDDVRTWWTRDGATLLVLRDGWLETLDAATATTSIRTSPLMRTGAVRGLHLFEDGRRLAFQAGEDRQVWVVDLVSGTRTAPADALENRGPWFQVLEDRGLVAVLADRTRLDAGRPARPSDANATNEDGAASAAKKPGKKEAAEKRVLWLVPLDPEGLTVETRFEEGERIEVSADGRFVLRTEQKRSPARKLIMADYLTDRVTTVDVRSSLPGDDGVETTIELYSIDDEEAFAPPIDEASHFWTHQATWSPSGARLLVHRLSNDFHVRQVLVVDAATRTGRLVFTERDDAWVGGPLLWAGWAGKTETVLFTSERSGWNHLYAHDLAAGETRPITDPARRAELHDLEVADDGTRVVVLMNDPDPAERHLFTVPLLPGGPSAVRRLTDGEGTATRPLLSLDASTVAFSWSTLGVPDELAAVSVADPAPTRLTDTVPKAYGEMAFPAPEIVEYENPDDGVKVRALLYKPVPFDPSRTYPAVLFIHGAGYLQNVTKSMTSYDVNMLFHHRLARKGYVVLDPDYRHSKGYGRDFRAAIHGHMGGKDLDDVVAGVDWLKRTGYVDGDRVGLYGGSYGGFMTLMALFTKPDVFQCGAALRSVTDWRTYNAWYTNARLGDPDDEQEKENYERSSPIDHVEGLKKPLLLLHGLKDSNVFAQDSIRLIEKLIELGKEFDAMLYPSQNHAFDDPESWIDEYKRIERWFDRHLKDPE